MENAVLAAVILVPLIFTYFLKSDAAICFLSVCTGFVLTQVSPDLKNAIGIHTPYGNKFDIVSLALLTAPVLVTLLIVRSKHSRSPNSLFFWLALVAALSAGALYADVARPLVHGFSKLNLNNSTVGSDLERAYVWIIGIGTVASFLLIWFASFSKSKHHK